MYEIITSTFGSIDLIADDGCNYEGPVMPGAGLWRAEGNFGRIVSQTFKAVKFSASFYRTLFRKKTTVALPLTPGLLHCVFCLKGNEVRILSNVKMKFHSGQYTFLPIHARELPLQMDKDAECWNFILSYDVSELESLSAYFPVVSTILNPSSIKRLFERSVWMDKYTSGLIHQMLHLNLEPALNIFLFEEWIDDLLYRTLIEFDKAPVRIQHLLPGDVGKIYEARKLILDDLKTHHSIEELSKKVGLNDFKIKEGFRQLFGKGPFALLKDARMDLAYDLLLHTTRPEKDIMTDAGYTSLTAFVKAFRSVYGIPPGHLRQQHKSDDKCPD